MKTLPHQRVTFSRLARIRIRSECPCKMHYSDSHYTPSSVQGIVGCDGDGGWDKDRKSKFSVSRSTAVACSGEPLVIFLLYMCVCVSVKCTSYASTVSHFFSALLFFPRLRIIY